jgi:hypothetical protein
VPVNQAHSESVLYFTSSPTSWVGQGQTVAQQITSMQQYHNQGAYTNALGFFTSDWSIYLVGPNYSLVTVGSYPNATRWPFQDDGAGLSLSGQGRGDNTLTGHFEVLEATYDNNQNLISLAANFTQYDEGNTNRWNTGYIHYNYPVPEPSTLALVAMSGFGLIAIAWRRRSQML